MRGGEEGRQLPPSVTFWLGLLGSCVSGSASSQDRDRTFKGGDTILFRLQRRLTRLTTNRRLRRFTDLIGLFRRAIRLLSDHATAFNSAYATQAIRSTQVTTFLQDRKMSSNFSTFRDIIISVSVFSNLTRAQGR